MRSITAVAKKTFEKVLEQKIRTFPKKLFVAMFIERMGAFLRHNNILIDLLTTPAPCVLCPGQAACRAFDKSNARGLPLQNSKVPAVPSRKLSGLWLRKNPRALMLHVAASLSFLSLAVMPFAGFLWRIFGETPDIFKTSSALRLKVKFVILTRYELLLLLSMSGIMLHLYSVSRTKNKN